jgi:hypothetical protein
MIQARSPRAAKHPGTITASSIGDRRGATAKCGSRRSRQPAQPAAASASVHVFPGVPAGNELIGMKPPELFARSNWFAITGPQLAALLLRL